MRRKDILAAAQEAGVHFVRLLYCDNNGIIRGKATSVRRLDNHLTDGTGLCTALMAISSFDEAQPVAGMDPVSEVRLVPDPDTFTVLPYAPHSATMYCDMVQLDRTPWPACPRSFLKRVRRQASEQGIQIQATFEVEFTLAVQTEDGYRPFDETVCYSAIALQELSAFSDDVATALAQQGVEVEEYHAELGHGQHEISVRHGDALQAADNQIRVRETIRAIARNHGLYASFAPKPFSEQPGNGAHIHVSLLDDAGHNLLYDPASPEALSHWGRHFVAGLLDHLPGLVALTCPSVNSYRRLVPESLSGAFAVYGYDNREAAIRIPSPFWSDVEGTTNIEFKPVDNSCNPYLALGTLLAAGLDGVSRQLDPGEPVQVDPATLSEGERRQMGIRRLPTTLSAALDRLEEDALLREVLPPLLAQSYLAVKRSEVAAYSSHDAAFEIAGHFYQY